VIPRLSQQRNYALPHLLVLFIPYYILCIAMERPWEWPSDGRGIFNVGHRRLDISTSLSMPASRHRSDSRQSDVSINIIIGQRDEALLETRIFPYTRRSHVSAAVISSRDDDIATCQFGGSFEPGSVAHASNELNKITVFPIYSRLSHARGALQSAPDDSRQAFRPSRCLTSLDVSIDSHDQS